MKSSFLLIYSLLILYNNILHINQIEVATFSFVEDMRSKLKLFDPIKRSNEQTDHISCRGGKDGTCNSASDSKGYKSNNEI